MKVDETTLTAKKAIYKSSTIDHSIYYHDDKTLKIKFKSGAEYIYRDVSKDAYSKFTVADSQGKYFNENIKDNFECVRLP